MAKTTTSKNPIKARVAARATDLETESSKPTQAKSPPAPMAPWRGVAHPASKKGTIEAMIRRPEGSAMSELVSATGWQKHSVRSALTLLRKAGCTIVCNRDASRTLYRLVEAPRPDPRASNLVRRNPKRAVSAGASHGQAARESRATTS